MKTPLFNVVLLGYTLCRRRSLYRSNDNSGLVLLCPFGPGDICTGEADLPVSAIEAEDDTSRTYSRGTILDFGKLETNFLGKITGYSCTYDGPFRNSTTRQKILLA